MSNKKYLYKLALEGGLQMQIVLVRHGQTEWNKEGRFQGIVDIPLNEIGKQEARFASNLLKQQKWDVVISSPLQRARETASIINEQLDCNSLVIEEFIKCLTI